MGLNQISIFSCYCHGSDLEAKTLTSLCFYNWVLLEYGGLVFICFAVTALLVYVMMHSTHSLARQAQANMCLGLCFLILNQLSLTK